MSWLFYGLGETPAAEGALRWTTPEAAMLLVGAVALLSLALAWRGERSLGARFGELALTALGLLALAVIAARPVWVEEHGRTEAGRAVALIDGSRSMRVMEGGASRGEAALAKARALQAEGVEVFTFGDELSSGLPAGFDLGATDLGGALAALEQRFAGERLASVALVTDGIDRGGLRDAWRGADQPVPPRLNGPLTIYQVGSAGSVRDLAVRRVDSGGFTFIKQRFVVTAQLEGAGFEGRSVTAQLFKDGAPAQEKPVTLDSLGRAEVSFEEEAWEEGRFNYEVRVPRYEGDAVPENNSAPLVVRVVRDRIRVLQVAGSPSWDVKFLRRFLKEDPSVDLVSFFILRTHDDMDTDYQNFELSLIAFPYEELFTEELKNFDVVVLQNFDYEPYFQRGANQLLGNLRRYVVEQGGALVMVGGDRSFDLGRYGRTPLHDVLPVKLGLDPNDAADFARFRPRLTEAGARHPITLLDADPEESRAVWERLRESDGTNRVLGLHPEAVALLEHPTLQGGDGKPLPVLAVREVGEGRTMALTVDASWRWSFSEAGAGRGNQAYLRFWKNSFRWLMDDPAIARVTVDTARENYSLGDTVRVVVRARDPGFGPLAGARVVVQIEGEGESKPMEGVTDREGELVLEWPAKRRGAWRAKAAVTRGEEAIGDAETVFAVTSRDPELSDVRPDGDFLAALAQATGGRYYGPGEDGPLLVDAGAGRTVSDRREIPVWRAPLLAALALLGLGGAWVVRRRAGLR